MGVPSVDRSLLLLRGSPPPPSNPLLPSIWYLNFRSAACIRVCVWLFVCLVCGTVANGFSCVKTALPSATISVRMHTEYSYRSHKHTFWAPSYSRAYNTDTHTVQNSALARLQNAKWQAAIHIFLKFRFLLYTNGSYSSENSRGRHRRHDGVCVYKLANTVQINWATAGMGVLLRYF